MGVRGLQSFGRDNRQSLSRTVILEKKARDVEPVPVIVDAWGVVYRLYIDSLPWTAGGEYLAFYRLTRKLVLAWRSVGLEPFFVFDGASPPEKHETLLSRLQSHISICRLFYTTSPPSRSGPSFSRNDVLLPPFASHAFIRALASLGVGTRFVLLGEADGVCVAIAEREGAYVVGQDSDLLIFAGATTQCRGYVPLGDMMWIEGPSEDASWRLGSGEQPVRDSDTGWEVQSAAPKRSHQRQSSLLPNPRYRRPQLVLLTYPGDLLRRRLRIPARMLPLFGSLVGNDYTPSDYADIFFEPGLNPSAKVERVARVIREQHPPAVAQDADDQLAAERAATFVAIVIGRLATRVHLSDQQKQDMADRIIEATLQYALPAPDDCCDAYPFCGALASGHVVGACHGFGSQDAPSVRGFAAAQRRGLVSTAVSCWLHPDRVYLWSMLENPSGPSYKVSERSRAVRTRAYGLIAEALGGMRWPPLDDEALEAAQEDKALEELLGLNGASGGTPHDAHDRIIHTNGARTPPRFAAAITEFARQGSASRITPATFDLVESTRDIPSCMLPLEERLDVYLDGMGAHTPKTRALDPRLHPLVAVVRLCVESAATREPWRRSEIQAVLRAGLGSLAAWDVDPLAQDYHLPDELPLLTTRNADIVAQFTAASTDAQLLAQALLLVDDDLTHISTWVFMSGIAMHMLLCRAEPTASTWKWTPALDETLRLCEDALWDGLDPACVVGPQASPPAHAATRAQPHAKQPRSRNSSMRTSPPKANGFGGRFASLHGLSD